MKEVKKNSTFANSFGEMAERLIAPVLKTGLGKTNGGSNPSLSAWWSNQAAAQNGRKTERAWFFWSEVMPAWNGTLIWFTSWEIRAHASNPSLSVESPECYQDFSLFLNTNEFSRHQKPFQHYCNRSSAGLLRWYLWPPVHFIATMIISVKILTFLIRPLQFIINHEPSILF